MKMQFYPRVLRPALVSLAAAYVFMAAGCAHLNAQRLGESFTDHSAEQSRVLTTALVDVLQHQPKAERDEFTALALTFAKEEQRLEGLPVIPLPVEQFLAIEKQSGPRPGHSPAPETSWDWNSPLSLALAGLLAAILFFPAAVPLLGRILAVLVSQMPSLAGPAGVVSVKAFDAVIQAIEDSKKNVRLGNDTAAQGSWLDELHANLSRALDASHKRLVRARKRSLNRKQPERPKAS
jgi:hypothetical protein